jgi:uncharacterized protein (TIGR00156 family)
MKKYTLFLSCCLVSLIAAATVCAQQGSTGQFGPGVGFTGPGSSGQFGYGFTGPSQTVSVAQALTYGHRTPVIIKGNIVQALGGDLYMFRDSSGEIVFRIGPREWQYYGNTISPSDTIEISGEVCYGRGWEPIHLHARSIRKR